MKVWMWKDVGSWTVEESRGFDLVDNSTLERIDAKLTKARKNTTLTSLIANAFYHEFPGSTCDVRPGCGLGGSFPPQDEIESATSIA